MEEAKDLLLIAITRDIMDLSAKIISACGEVPHDLVRAACRVVSSLPDKKPDTVDELLSIILDSAKSEAESVLKTLNENDISEIFSGKGKA